MWTEIHRNIYNLKSHPINPPPICRTTGNDNEEVLAQTMAHAWRDPANFGDLSPDVVRLLCSMLEVNPSKRITTAEILQVLFKRNIATQHSAVTHMIHAAHMHRTSGLLGLLKGRLKCEVPSSG